MDIDEAGGLDKGVELRAGTRVSVDGSEALGKYVILFTEVLLLSKRIVVGFIVYIKVLELSLTASALISGRGTLSWSTSIVVYLKL